MPKQPQSVFSTLFEAAMEISKNKWLTAADLRLLFYLITQMEFGNWVHVGQRAMAQYMGTTQSTVWRSLRKLEQLGLVVQQIKTSKPVYRVSPRIAFRGSARAYRSARIDFGLDPREIMLFDATDNDPPVTPEEPDVPSKD